MQWNEISVIMPKLFIYSTVGVLNTLADFVVFLLLTSGLGYHPIPANMISYSIGVVLSFIMNRTFAFRASNYYFGIHHQFFRFCAVNIVSLAISTALVNFFSQSMTPPFAKILSIPFVVMWGFLAVRAFVFASPTPSIQIQTSDSLTRHDRT
jgi:putative flippase GtrA